MQTAAQRKGSNISRIIEIDKYLKSLEPLRNVITNIGFGKNAKFSDHYRITVRIVISTYSPEFKEVLMLKKIPFKGLGFNLGIPEGLERFLKKHEDYKDEWICDALDEVIHLLEDIVDENLFLYENLERWTKMFASKLKIPLSYKGNDVSGCFINVNCKQDISFLPSKATVEALGLLMVTMNRGSSLLELHAGKTVFRGDSEKLEDLLAGCKHEDLQQTQN